MQVGAYAGSSLASHPAQEGYHPRLAKPRGGGALTVVEQDGLTPATHLVQGRKAILAEPLLFQHAIIEPAAQLNQCGKVRQAPREVKSCTLLIVISVRKARPSLKYCLRTLLVVNADTGQNAFANHARVQLAGSSFGHPSFKDQAHPVRTAQIEIISNQPQRKRVSLFFLPFALPIHKAIPRAALGEDVARVRRVRLDLLAQVGDV